MADFDIITVWGWDWRGFFDDFSEGYNDFYFSGALGEPPALPPADEAEMKVDYDPSLYSAAEIAVIEKFKNTLADLSSRMSRLNAGSVFNYHSGGSIRGSEFLSVWFKADWTIVPRGTTFANGQGGQVVANGGDPIVTIRIDTLLGYDSASPFGTNAGLNHLALHEIAHAVGMSVSHHASIHADGILTATEQAAHERMAQDIARAVAYAIGVDVFPNVPYLNGGPEFGYSPDFPQFSPPPSPPAGPWPTPFWFEESEGPYYYYDHFGNLVTGINRPIGPWD
jgi:hypothetical protein